MVTRCRPDQSKAKETLTKRLLHNTLLKTVTEAAGEMNGKQEPQKGKKEGRRKTEGGRREGGRKSQKGEGRASLNKVSGHREWEWSVASLSKTTIEHEKNSHQHLKRGEGGSEDRGVEYKEEYFHQVGEGHRHTVAPNTHTHKSIIFSRHEKENISENDNKRCYLLANTSL